MSSTLSRWKPALDSPSLPPSLLPIHPPSKPPIPRTHARLLNGAVPPHAPPRARTCSTSTSSTLCRTGACLQTWSGRGSRRVGRAGCADCLVLPSPVWARARASGRWLPLPMCAFTVVLPPPPTHTHPMPSTSGAPQVDVEFLAEAQKQAEWDVDLHGKRFMYDGCTCTPSPTHPMPASWPAHPHDRPACRPPPPPHHRSR
jgi:hypothetical protein